jgi:hypothetical protein
MQLVPPIFWPSFGLGGKCCGCNLLVNASSRLEATRDRRNRIGPCSSMFRNELVIYGKIERLEVGIQVEIESAQSELRRAYLRGGPGAIVSGLVWCVSGIVASRSGVSAGFAVLFFGGMLIFPIATLIVRGFLGRKPVSKKNPGGVTVIETIVPMITGLMAAWLLMPYRPEFVFPISAIAVGAHYFGFRTAYGDWTNWVLGGTMCMVGLGSIFVGTPSPHLVPYLIAAIETAFGSWLTWKSILTEN